MSGNVEVVLQPTRTIRTGRDAPTGVLLVLALAAASLAAAGCSCGGPMVPGDALVDASVNCQHVLPDAWRYLEWSFSDGTRGSTGCAGPTLFFGDTSASGSFSQALGVTLASSDSPGFVAPLPLPWPVDCREEGSLVIRNYEWTTGAVGTVDPLPHSPDFNDAAPIFYVEVGIAPPGTTQCMPLETAVERIGPRSGRWEITQGGTFGEVIEVHIYDVEFELHDGRVFTIEHGAWRGTVLGPRVLP